METQLAGMQKRVGMALGEEPCDLALVHADVVDVFGREILRDRTVLVGDGVVLAVLPAQAVPEPAAREVVDCTGRVLLPGLMDAHVHIESTLLTPERFAEAVLPCGTTRVVADPHEIANVCGVEGIEYMLSASEDLPVTIHVALPSCVPCTPFEDAGACLDAASLAPLWRHERVCSLGEVMNVPGVLGRDADLLAKILAARRAGRRVDGHCPGLAGPGLQAYAACGIGNDHEELDEDLLREHVRAGMYVFVREGSAAKSLARVLPAVTGDNAWRFCFCTDDLHAEDILARGHVNAILARAVHLGLPAPVAVAMATINPALCFGIANAGAVAPGYRADLVLVDDVRDFAVRRVWSRGECVAEDGRARPFRAPVPVPERILNSMRPAPLDEGSLRLAVPSGRARIIRMLPHDLCTKAEIREVRTADGCFEARANPGLCKVAVVERHRASGLVGLGILAGYAREDCLLGGALATSISHDSHNIVVAGSSDADMIRAVETVAQLGGGVALVRDGEVVASLRLPVAGLMTFADAAQVAGQFAAIEAAARTLAVRDDVDPVMSLSFMALCVIPELKLNTRGLFDVTRFDFVPVDAGGE